VLLDSFANSEHGVIGRLRSIVGDSFVFVEADVRDRDALGRAMRAHGVRAVIHLAGLKAVGESAALPLAYYDNNLVGTLRLLEAMDDVGVRSLVFSSSATVYGEPRSLPIREDHPLCPTSPYGRTKLMAEQVLEDIARLSDRWHICVLRYFNPVGAHESGAIGERPAGIPNNLMPLLVRVASGEQRELLLLGDDYATADGSGVRDFIHVVDLASGHVDALGRLPSLRFQVLNLGTGRGTSVRELVGAFERVNGVRIPIRVGCRRAGDVAASFADPGLSHRILGWGAIRSIDDMCRDAWRWHQRSVASARARESDVRSGVAK
jgi:UDP-glucose 4-epimerase